MKMVIGDKMLLGCKRDGRAKLGTQRVLCTRWSEAQHQRRGVWGEGASGDR